MNKRLFKQLIVALLFLVIVAFIFVVINYFRSPDPTCFDNIKNQDEEETDCGGPCLSCELINIEELKVLWVKVLSNKEGFYDLAAEIKNPNQNYGSGNVDYKFELYDYNDNLIAEYSGKTFILPNQTKYIIKTKTEEANSVRRANVTFNQVEWKKPFNYYPPEFAIQQKEYYFLDNESLGVSQARAVLVNKTSFDFEKIDIDVLLFDALNNLIAVNSTEVRTLPVNQERDFVVTWFEEIDGEVSYVEIEPETNIFDPDNYISIDTDDVEEFQEY